MKQLILMLLAVVGITTICSCTDTNTIPEEPVTPVTPDEPDEPEVPDTTANYLVMHYCVAGGLDKYMLSNVLHAFSEGSTEKVKMAFQFKHSLYYQSDNEEHLFNGVRRFTVDENEYFLGKYKEITDNPYLLSEAKWDSLYNHVKTEKIGDATYDMTSKESLTDFIKWCKEKYPNAKRTILVLSGHGRGWQFQIDGLQDAKTRASLEDNNFQDEPRFLTLNDIVEGVKMAGGVDALYTDACLMSMYENLYGYKDIAKYLITAVETTPGPGGNYEQFLKELKNAGSTDEEFEKAMHGYIDFCTSKDWWGVSDSYYFDLGIYNLSKLEHVNSVLKKTVDTLVEKYTSDESIKPMASDLLLGTTFAPYIRWAVTDCEVARFTGGLKQQKLKMSYQILNVMRKDGIKDDEEGYYDVCKVIDWLRFPPSDAAKELIEKYPEQWNRALLNIIEVSDFTFILTDLLRQLDNKLYAVGAQNNPFKQLRTELQDAIKEIAYIRCSELDEKPGVDQAYELCSPGITIVPLSAELYHSDRNRRINTDIPSEADALKMYQSLEFDKQVGWSRFLQLIDVIPTALTNPSRRMVK